MAAWMVATEPRLPPLLRLSLLENHRLNSHLFSVESEAEMFSLRIGQALRQADATPSDLLLEGAHTFGNVATWIGAKLGISGADIVLIIGVLGPLALYLLWTSTAGPPPGPPPPGWDL